MRIVEEDLYVRGRRMAATSGDDEDNDDGNEKRPLSALEDPDVIAYGLDILFHEWTSF